MPIINIQCLMEVFNFLSMSITNLPKITLQRFEQGKTDLTMMLKERVQNPSSCTFCIEDLVWIKHVPNGKGKYKISMLAVILRDRLDGSTNVEQRHPQFRCKYTKDILRFNLPNSLTIPRATSLAFLLTYPLFSMFFV